MDQKSLDFHISIASTLSKLFDNQFQLGNIRFGLDPLIGILPGIGDALPMFVSLYIIWIGKKINIPNSAVRKMVINILIDVFVGTIPLIGDITDAFFKANTRNLNILLKYTHETNLS